MKYLFQIVLIIPIVVFGQMSNDEIEAEISSLNDSKQLQEYWISLHKKDQSVRGKFSETQTKVDRENLKKNLPISMTDNSFLKNIFPEPSFKPEEVEKVLQQYKRVELIDG